MSYYIWNLLVLLLITIVYCIGYYGRKRTAKPKLLAVYEKMYSVGSSVLTVAMLYSFVMLILLEWGRADKREMMEKREHLQYLLDHSSNIDKIALSKEITSFNLSLLEAQQLQHGKENEFCPDGFTKVSIVK